MRPITFEMTDLDIIAATGLSLADPLRKLAMRFDALVVGREAAFFV